jgi:hypothetical protein
LQIKHTTETPEGDVVFQGKLEGPELAFVIEVGINTLLAQGALPFASTKKVKMIDLYMDESEVEH